MDLVKQILEQHGIEHFGFSELTTPLSLNFYKSWLEKDYHGDMKYLNDHLDQKTHPEKLLPSAKSAIVITHPYGGGEQRNSFPLKANKVAAYARDGDYHYWLKQKLVGLCADLKKLYPQHEFLSFTDSSPVMERDLAHRAGLGWFGKNTCLLDRKKGSLFFIAEIYTSLSLKGPVSLPTDHCGTCTRCIDACPTQAIEENKTLNANKCISYWTIESRGIPPVDLRKNFSGWLFGCDICQTVCPWNIKAFQLTEEPLDIKTVAEEIRWILRSSNKELERKLAQTPLSRTGGRGLKRNALIVIANLKISDLSEEVKLFLNDEKLGSLATWTLEQLSGR
jgi:epoxyqueuosine reductase